MQRRQGGEEPSQPKRMNSGGGEGTEADGAIMNELARRRGAVAAAAVEERRRRRQGADGAAINKC
jgi:hypothetical protein